MFKVENLKNEYTEKENYYAKMEKEIQKMLKYKPYYEKYNKLKDVLD